MKKQSPKRDMGMRGVLNGQDARNMRMFSKQIRTQDYLVTFTMFNGKQNFL